MSWTKPVVVLDCDGVLANWVGPFCKLAKEMLLALNGSPFGAPTLYASHDEAPAYRTDAWPGWTDKRFIGAVWRTAKERKNWFWEMEPIHRHDYPALIDLAEQSKLYVVTARPDCNGAPMNELTQHWIEEHFNAHVSVIAVPGSREKCRVISALNPAFVVDDSPVVLNELRNVYQIPGRVLRRAYQYNGQAPCDASVEGISDFYVNEFLRGDTLVVAA